MKNIFFIVSITLLAASCGGPDKKPEPQSTPVAISNTAAQASCVYLTADEKKLPVISWCETDRRSGVKRWYMAFFDQENNGFSSPMAIPLEQQANLHEEGMPKIAFKGDGTIIGVYETSANSEKNRFAGFVNYIVSTDRGRSWSSPARLHADSSADKSHSFAAITRLSDGEIGACWLDESLDPALGGRPVKFARTNQDNRFENELIIDSVACECCRIAMASNTKGRVVVAFRDIVHDSIRDMSISRSDDDGRSFTPAVSFSNDGWIINGCPHNGPSLAAADDAIYATWFTGGPQRGVYYGELNNDMAIINKQLVSAHGRFIQLCLLQNGSRVLAYSENMQEEGGGYVNIALNKIDGDKLYADDIKMEKSMAGYPVVQSFGANHIVAAWTSKEKVYYQVRDADAISAPVKRSPAGEGHKNAEYDNRAAPSPNPMNVKLASPVDLVCGMSLSLSPADTAMFKGGVYGFCSETCKEKFILDPAAFVKQ